MTSKRLAEELKSTPSLRPEPPNVISVGRLLLGGDFVRTEREARKASSITCPKVNFSSLDFRFAKSSNASEMEMVVLMHQVIFKKHHDVNEQATRNLLLIHATAPHRGYGAYALFLEEDSLNRGYFRWCQE
ncbi:MAG: hypothetical protein WCP60_11500 [bacterium]